MLKKRHITSLAIGTAMVLCSGLTPAHAVEVRTAGRIVSLDTSSFPPHLSMRKVKKHSWSYNPVLDPVWNKYRHPQQWKGLEWDTGEWPEGMSDEHVLNALYGADVFRRQYVTRKGKAVVEVGKKFYKLSDLDRRRSLKLLSDYFDFFSSGYPAFTVKDAKTRQKLGEYNSKGFQAN